MAHGIHRTIAAAASRLLGTALRLGIRINHQLRRIVMASEAAEALAPMELPKMIEGLGLAVANANKALYDANADTPSVLVIHSAEIDVAVAVTVDKSTTASGTAGLQLKAFSVNAAYARSYNSKEEASSRIKITLSARPREA
jgi:hypothetical protein